MSSAEGEIEREILCKGPQGVPSVQKFLGDVTLFTSQYHSKMKSFEKWSQFLCISWSSKDAQKRKAWGCKCCYASTVLCTVPVLSRWAFYMQMLVSHALYATVCRRLNHWVKILISRLLRCSDTGWPEWDVCRWRNGFSWNKLQEVCCLARRQVASCHGDTYFVLFVSTKFDLRFIKNPYCLNCENSPSSDNSELTAHVVFGEG